MCGRFVQSLDPADYAAYFGAEQAVADPPPPSYNVAPTDRVYAVAEHEGRRLLGTFRWGLVPWWAKAPGIGSRHINARAETLAERPAFKDSFLHRRCIVPADGFYEWQRRPDGGKLPHYIHRPGEPLALAGLWSSWKEPDTGERLSTCTIVTTDADELLRPIHGRMPVVLPPDAWGRWLDRETTDPEELETLLRGPAPGPMEAYPVSTLVNDVRNDYPECIVPLEHPPGG
jgi:putative SOS response-associated peptidase YedK